MGQQLYQAPSFLAAVQTLSAFGPWLMQRMFNVRQTKSSMLTALQFIRNGPVHEPWPSSTTSHRPTTPSSDPQHQSAGKHGQYGHFPSAQHGYLDIHWLDHLSSNCQATV